jgi:hypothetical protein
MTNPPIALVKIGQLDLRAIESLDGEWLLLNLYIGTVMRIASGIFCVIMVAFTVVQFNDPDALLWAIIYGVIAIWCGLAAFRTEILSKDWGSRLLVLSLALASFAVVWYFPKTPGFWHTEVWWETETAREGMGMMVAFIALIVAWLTGRSRNTFR